MNKTKELSLYKKIFLVAMLMSHGISIGKLYLYHIFLVLNIFYIFVFLIQNGKIEKNIIKVVFMNCMKIVLSRKWMSMEHCRRIYPKYFLS